MEEQLRTLRLVDACKEAGHSAKIRMQPGYDHFYFVIDDHLRHHARAVLGTHERGVELA